MVGHTETRRPVLERQTQTQETETATLVWTEITLCAIHVHFCPPPTPWLWSWSRSSDLGGDFFPEIEGRLVLNSLLLKRCPCHCLPEKRDIQLIGMMMFCVCVCSCEYMYLQGKSEGAKWALLTPPDPLLITR